MISANQAEPFWTLLDWKNIDTKLFMNEDSAAATAAPETTLRDAEKNNHPS